MFQRPEKPKNFHQPPILSNFLSNVLIVRSMLRFVLYFLCFCLSFLLTQHNVVVYAEIWQEAFPVQEGIDELDAKPHE